MFFNCSKNNTYCINSYCFLSFYFESDVLVWWLSLKGLFSGSIFRFLWRDSCEELQSFSLGAKNEQKVIILWLSLKGLFSGSIFRFLWRDSCEELQSFSLGAKSYHFEPSINREPMNIFSWFKKLLVSIFVHYNSVTSSTRFGFGISIPPLGINSHSLIFRNLRIPIVLYPNFKG